MQDDIKEIKTMVRAIINGQSSMKAELLGEITKHRNETEKGFKEVNDKIDNVETNLTIRIDYLGKQLNALDEDAPTGEDFTKLVKRVDKHSLLLRSKLKNNQNFTTA